MPYHLSASLSGHSADVRAVASPTNDLVLSASRDSTAVSWARQSHGSSFTQISTFHPTQRYINAVAYLPPDDEAPLGYIVTGGQDALIYVFPIGSTTNEPKYTLVGHSQNVCKLHTSTNGLIISGSWDSTAKVWKNAALLHDLKGHTQAVWAVTIVGEDQHLTGSADKTIRLWQQHKTIRTFDGHTDVVRDIVNVPDIGFASCSNDSEIRVWTLGGDAVYTLNGHTSFVYSLSVLPTGDIVSGGEDRTVRIWRDGECIQTIVHPAISVWSVSTMPNGDIVSGCSDRIVRVFSSAEERWASADERKTLEDQVAAQALSSQQIGDVKKVDLPGIEALDQPGQKEGQVKMVNNSGTVEAHQWDGSAGRWQKIGDVVDSVGSGRKQLYNGIEYDYVFDVDIQDGVPPLKLPYNASENPYAAAQRFLQANDLALSYIDQVVQFIENNTSGVTLGGTDFVDPFTGASRYQPSQASSQVAGGNDQFVDPFTGASRYQSSAPTPAAVTPTPSLDPFTGASGYRAGLPPTSNFAALPANASMKSVLPVRIPLAFKQANVAAMQGKVYQFNNDLQSEISTSSLALYPEEITSLEATFTYLSQAVASPSTPLAPAITASHVDNIRHILERWPSGQLFPVIDLARLAIGFCPTAFDQGKEWAFFETLFKASGWDEPWSANKSRDTNVLLLFRALANAFQEGTFSASVEWIEPVLRKLKHVPYGQLNKTQRVTLATILFNLSTLTLGPIDMKVAGLPDVGNLHIELICLVLHTEREDSETAYRALVALGNVLFSHKTHSASLAQAQLAEMRVLVGEVSRKFSEERVKSVSAEVNKLL